MITEIGFTAGDIWNYLDKYGEATLKDIAKGIGKPKDVVCMSLGWLAREGHAELTRVGKDYSAKLRKR